MVLGGHVQVQVDLRNGTVVPWEGGREGGRGGGRREGGREGGVRKGRREGQGHKEHNYIHTCTHNHKHVCEWYGARERRALDAREIRRKASQAKLLYM